MKQNRENDDLFKGLRELVESTFPKTCRTCGKVYQNAGAFLKETENLPTKRSCLKEAIEDDGSTLVEVYRNCSCGSTLMDEFRDRRDLSEKGLKRRKVFARMHELLVGKGLDVAVAKAELIKAARGETSEILEQYFPQDNERQ